MMAEIALAVDGDKITVLDYTNTNRPKLYVLDEKAKKYRQYYFQPEPVLVRTGPLNIDEG